MSHRTGGRGFNHRNGSTTVFPIHLGHIATTTNVKLNGLSMYSGFQPFNGRDI
nr:MAG TPA: cytidylyltransferase-like protein [Bacteriophage sp.]